VAPFPTTAEIVVALVTEKEVAAVPPKLTAVAPVKLVPVIVIVVPGLADVGVKDVMVGTGTTGGPELLSFLQEIIKTESSRNPEIVKNVFLNLFMFKFLRIEGFAIDVMCL
jgi:hypothetical protein